MPRGALRDILCVLGIYENIIHLTTGLSFGTEGAVKFGGGIPSFFPVNSGERQVCVLAHSLFNTCMDRDLNQIKILDWDRIANQCPHLSSYGFIGVPDLVFAEDTVLLSESL